MATNAADQNTGNIKPIFYFVMWSLLGLIVFFMPISYKDSITIPLDYIEKTIENLLPWFGPIFALLIITVGGILPFYDKSWKQDSLTCVLSILKLLGIGAGVMAYCHIGPEWLMNEKLLPNLWINVVVPVSIIVPLGSIFLTFIIGYGLMEFIGILLRSIVRPVWKLPGRAAVDASASFVGSFAIAMFLTNRLYKEGIYTERETAIILTGFSSVSASFMVIIATRLKLMEYWWAFFLTALIVTYLVTAITARIYPIRSISDTYYRGSGHPERKPVGNLFRNAFRAGVAAARNADSLHRNIWNNLKEGMMMTFRLISVIISVGLITFVLAETTSVFDYIGYIFYPFTYLTQLPDSRVVATATALAGAEVFVPSLRVSGIVGVSLMSKFVVGVVSISMILFFSGSIPCVLATDVRLSIKTLVIIMMERAILSLLIVAPIAHFLF